MGTSHVEVFRDHCADDAVGVAVYDPHPPSVEKAKAALPALVVCDCAEDLLDSGIDAVVIATPNCTHLEYTVQALSAGKHVFCEKPVATTVEDCRRMAQLAETSDHVLFIGHEFRHSAYFQKIKRLIDEGALGAPQVVWCHEFRGPFKEKVDRWIIDERRSGGALVDKNGHHFDLMNWWVDSRPRRVSAFGSKRFNNILNTEHEVIDNATVSFEYENGVVGTLVLSMFAPGYRGGDELACGVIGDKGLLETQISRSTITVWPREGEADDKQVYTMESDIAGFGSHVGYIEEHLAFVEACRTGERPLTDVRDCVDATLLAVAAERAIKDRTIVDIE